MKIALLFLVLTGLVICPAVSAAQSQRATGSKSSEGSEIKDSWITSKTKMKLVGDKRTKARQIKVETERGVVTLRGKVTTAEERAAAEEVTRGVDGVKGVRNTLEVVPERTRKAADARDDQISKTVKDRFDADGQLQGASIRVRADNGMVTLMGTVPNVQLRERAGDLARKVPGVRAVRNELQLKS